VNRSRSIALEAVLSAALVVPATITTTLSDGRLLLRLQASGGDLVLYYTTYELRESRVLTRSRTKPFGDSLQIRLSVEEYRRCLALLEEGGYPPTSWSTSPGERPRRRWSEYTLVMSWGLSLFRAGQLVDTEAIPERSLARYVPELEEDHRIRAGWALLSFFEEKFDE